MRKVFGASLITTAVAVSSLLLFAPAFANAQSTATAPSGVVKTVCGLLPDETADRLVVPPSGAIATAAYAINRFLQWGNGVLTEFVAAPEATAQFSCIPPPGPKELGEDCGGNTCGPPHALGPSFCAGCCVGETLACSNGTIEGCCSGVGYCDAEGNPVCPGGSSGRGCREQCEDLFGPGTPYLRDSITGICGCEPCEENPGGIPPSDGDGDGGPPGGSTCSDTNGDGRLDACVVGGESNVVCDVDANCLRSRHTECNQSQQCIIVDAPGIDQCGAPWNQSPPQNDSCSFSSCPAPNTNTCGGKYTLNNPAGVNYGDPTCAFSMSKAIQLIRSLENDPVKERCWIEVVVPCESSFVPNVTVPAVNGLASGLFQMGDCSSSFASPDLSCRGLNGVYDRGDVCWGRQISNAIQYSKLLDANPDPSIGSFDYWECAINPRFDPQDICPDSYKGGN